MKQVVLVNYGGPEEEAQVAGYLFRLLSDRNVIQLPAGKAFQGLFARTVSQIRAGKLKKAYKIIGGSPLPRITRSLVQKLNKKGKHKYSMAMAYSPPFIPETLDSLREKEVFLFPLFPHFSRTTTGACLSLARKSRKRLFYLKEYWQDPEFNGLVLKQIKEKAGKKKNTSVLLSAHSIPLRYSAKGDPYLESIHRHFKLLDESLPGIPFFLAFQSPLGPVKWAGPPLEEVLLEIESRGFQEVVFYPLSFVIDNFETVFEIDISVQNDIISKLKLSFQRTPCLNDSDEFVSFIEKQLEEKPWSELA